MSSLAWWLSSCWSYTISPQPLLCVNLPLTKIYHGVCHQPASVSSLAATQACSRSTRLTYQPSPWLVTLQCNSLVWAYFVKMYKDVYQHRLDSQTVWWSTRTTWGSTGTSGRSLRSRARFVFTNIVAVRDGLTRKNCCSFGFCPICTAHDRGAANAVTVRQNDKR